MTQSHISFADYVQPFAMGAYVTKAVYIDDAFAFALGDGRIQWLNPHDPDSPLLTVDAHPKASILVTAHSSRCLITGGDDGRVIKHFSPRSTQTHMQILHEAHNKSWIDAIAVSHAECIAWSVDKNVFSLDAKGNVTTCQAPSSVRGLAYAPKGYRLAVAHYNGASLWYPSTQSTPELLEWSGAHLDVIWSQDGRYVITSLQENALHGWRLSPTSGHMRMTGYSAKVRSVSWSHDGQWLATSGDKAVILWSFTSKEGPMGKAPRECGEHSSSVSAVQFHPKALVLAVGYQDGSVRLVRLTDAAEIHVQSPLKNNSITSLAWSSDGRYLAFGATGGAAGLLTLP